MLHKVGSTPFGRHVLPDGTRTAGVEQQAAHQPVFGIRYQTGELSRRTRQQEGDGGTVDEDHLIVAFARRRHRFVVERLAEEVVKLPVVLLSRRNQRVDLAVHDQQACLTVVAQVDEQLRLRHLTRHDQVADVGRLRGILHRHGLMLATKLRLLGLPVIERLLVLLYLTFALGLDKRGVMVGQMAHLIDTTFPVGCRSHLDRIEMRGQPFATVIAVHTGQAGAQDGTGGEHAHVALAYVGIVTDRFADDWRQLLQEVVRKAGRLLPKLLPFLFQVLFGGVRDFRCMGCRSVRNLSVSKDFRPVFSRMRLIGRM